MAIEFHQQRQLDQVEQIYRLILQQVPNHPESLHFLGMLEHQRGDHAAAVALIEQALQQAPDYADAYNNLGNILHFQGKAEAAVSNYRKPLAFSHGEAYIGASLMAAGLQVVE